MAKEVVALAMGFFDGKRRREGETFLVPDSTTARWFAEVEGPAHKAQKSKEAKEKAKAKEEPRTLSELARAPAKAPVDKDDEDIV